jgi:hypothetical protein
MGLLQHIIAVVDRSVKNANAIMCWLEADYNWQHFLLLFSLYST